MFPKQSPRQLPYGQIPHSFARAEGVSANAKLVLLVLNSFNPCFPSYTRLMRCTGKGKSTLVRAVAELERLRVIAVARGGRSTGSNRYVIQPWETWDWSTIGLRGGPIGDCNKNKDKKNNLEFCSEFESTPRPPKEGQGQAPPENSPSPTPTFTQPVLTFSKENKGDELSYPVKLKLPIRTLDCPYPASLTNEIARLAKTLVEVGTLAKGDVTEAVDRNFGTRFLSDLSINQLVSVVRTLDAMQGGGETS